MDLLNAATLAQKLSVSRSWVNKNYDALPHIVLGNNGKVRKQVRFDWQDVLTALNADTTTGFLLTPLMLAQRIGVSKSWIQKNFKTIPHIILPNTDSGKRNLVRFDYNAVIEFLKGGRDEH